MPFDLILDEAAPLFARVRDVFSPAAANDILLAAGRRVGVAAEGLVSAYPAASGKPLARYYTRTRKDGTTFRSKFKTLAQQKKVFALIQKGKVPYPRSGQLGRSIVSRAEAAGAGLIIVHVGTNLTYAPYVIGKLMQSHYHRGNWTPLEDDIRRGLSELQRVGVRAVQKEIDKRLNNG